MKKLNKQRSRFYCSNFFAIVLTIEGEHVKDCRKKTDFDDFAITNKGSFIVINDNGVIIFKSNTVLTNASLN